MKRFFGAMLALMLALSLCACSLIKAENMSVKPSSLSAEEKKIVKLLSGEDKGMIYDYNLDKSGKSAVVTTYELTGGRWSESSSGGFALDKTSGRFALKFQQLGGEIGITSAFEQRYGWAETTSIVPYPDESLNVWISVLEDSAKVNYESPMPLAIIVITDRPQEEYDLDLFNTPQKLASIGARAVYAVAVNFAPYEIG